MKMSNAREVIAKRVARMFKDGDVVNLGIGLPTQVANHLPEGTNLIIHSENGVTMMGPQPSAGAEDKDTIDAGGRPSTILPGGACFDSAMSFAIIRGGHVDATVLGALQVDKNGNLANWMVPGKVVPGMGGAMDLVVGAKKVIIAMEHKTKNGEPKILTKCTLPLTAVAEVDLIVTELGLMEITKEGIVVRELALDITPEKIQSQTEAVLIFPKDISIME
jgi:acetate CoA/acetoacetate CoA-transferase beta subunit